MQVINIFFYLSVLYKLMNIHGTMSPCMKSLVLMTFFKSKTKPVNVLRQRVQESEFEIISLLVALLFFKE